MQRPPMTAQKVLPVIDDPVITFVPCPTQTTPVRKRVAPTTRLARITDGTTRPDEVRFALSDAPRNRVSRPGQCSGMTPEPH
jgi:hypothetical protein